MVRFCVPALYHLIVVSPVSTPLTETMESQPCPRPTENFLPWLYVGVVFLNSIKRIFAGTSQDTERV